MLFHAGKLFILTGVYLRITTFGDDLDVKQRGRVQ